MRPVKTSLAVLPVQLRAVTGRRLVWRTVGALAILLHLAGGQQRVAAATAMIFCNGNMGSASGLTASQITGLRTAGFTTMVLFTMSVQTNGDFTFSDGSTICSGGVYLGSTNWASLLNQCRVAPTGINRIEMCIAQWGDTSFGNIKNRIAADGAGAGTVLSKNLQALKSALGIDAIDYDDETVYDSASAISFGQMCAAAGLKVTLCPYTNPGYWQAVKTGLGTNCDQIYLQCYDGGAGNNPATWNTYFGGLKVVAGYWDWERDTTFLTKMQTGQSAGCTGGFLWPSCTGCNPPADGNEMSQYAAWILDTFNPVVTPVTAADVVGGQTTFAVNFGGDSTYQWQVIRGGTTNDIAGATNAVLTLANLQLTNTAYYRVLVTNAGGTFVSSAGSLTVGNAPAAVNNIITTSTAQTGLAYGLPFTPTWTLASGSLIAGQPPVGTNGNFNLEAYGGGRTPNSLTAGGTLTISQPGGVTSTNCVTCGNDGTAGSALVYPLTNASAGGYFLTNITVYGGWKDAGRDQQAYTVAYSKVAAPATFITLGSVSFNPANAAGVPAATRVTLSAANGILATNVAAVKFDFTSPASENGYCGYAGITMQGIPVSPQAASGTLPVTAADVVGSQVTLVAAFTAARTPAYQWQKISGGSTNNITGATNTMLTLTNLQLTDTGNYRLQAANTYGVAVSSASSLTVSSLPAAVNNVITAFAAQTGTGGGMFTPTWTMTKNSSLIAGQIPGTVAGNFSEEISGRSVNVLTAGSLGLAQIASPYGYTTSTNYVTGGNGTGPDGSSAGSLLIYPLTGSASGYNLTNLTVYGGWADAGRDQQAYTVYYSKMAAPATFQLLARVNYNPANPANAPSATRATLTPASGVLASNVAAVKVDFTTPAAENGFCGYAAISLGGVPTVVVASNPTNITYQVAAGQLTLSWPADHLGWRLQVQTNSLARGLGTNWIDLAGSAVTNQFSLRINSASGSVFYRLANP